MLCHLSRKLSVVHDLVFAIRIPTKQNPLGRSSEVLLKALCVLMRELSLFCDWARRRTLHVAQNLTVAHYDKEVHFRQNIVGNCVVELAPLAGSLDLLREERPVSFGRLLPLA